MIKFFESIDFGYFNKDKSAMAKMANEKLERVCQTMYVKGYHEGSPWKKVLIIEDEQTKKGHVHKFKCEECEALIAEESKSPGGGRL